MAYADAAAGKRRTKYTGAAVASVATADATGTYGAGTATLINELKAQLNAALAELRKAGVISP